MPVDIEGFFRSSHEIQQLVTSIRNIDSNISKLAGNLSGLGRNVPTAGAAPTSGDPAAPSLASSGVTVDLLAVQTEMLTTWKSIADITKGMKSNFEAFGRSMQDLRNASTGGLESSITGLLNKIPYVGTLIGMAFQSQVENAERIGKGKAGVYGFRSSQNVSNGDIVGKGTDTASLGKLMENGSYGSMEDATAALGAFAAGGTKIADVFKESGAEIEGFGQKMLGMSIATDKAFGASAGASAKFSVQLATDTGTSVDKATQVMAELGEVARKTDQAYESLAGTILQVTSSLRTQTSDGKELANSYLAIHKAMKGLMPGQSEQAVNAMTNEAFGGMGGAMKSMPEGMRAAIGAAIAQRHGIDANGIEGLDLFDTGFKYQGGKGGSDARGHFVQEALDEGYKMFSRLDKSGRIQAMTQFYGSRTFAHAMETSGGHLQVGSEEYKKAIEGKDRDLKEAHGKATLTNDDFKTTMDSIKAVLDGSSTIMISLLQGILYGIVGGFDVLAHGGKGRGAYADTMGKVFRNMGGAIDSIINGSAGGAKAFGRFAMGGSGTFELPSSSFTEQEKLDDAMHEALRKNLQTSNTAEIDPEFYKWRDEHKNASAAEGMSEVEALTRAHGGTQMSREDLQKVFMQNGIEFKASLKIEPTGRVAAPPAGRTAS